MLDGTEVCRLLRARPATAALPIIMLTARTGETDRVSGLDLGADDYVTKPFSLRELAARVRAVLRRKPGARPTAMSIYRGKHVVADFDAVSVTVDGEPIRLTRREFELLKCLVENRNRVLSRDRLLERVWGYEQFIETRSVDVHVGRLRSKLGPAGDQNRDGRGVGLSLRGVGRDARRRGDILIGELEHLNRALDAMPVGVLDVADDPVVPFLSHGPAGFAPRDGHALGMAVLHELAGQHHLAPTDVLPRSKGHH